MNDKEQTAGSPSNALKVALVLVANIVAGVLTPLLISWLTGVSFTVAEGTIVGLLTILSLTVTELLFRVEAIHGMRRGEIELWNLREGIDDKLEKMRTGLHALIADASLRDSFYLDHYSRELDLVQDRIQNTIARKELLLDRHHIDSTAVLFSLFNAKRHHVFRASAPLRDIGDEFDVTFGIYFYAWLDLLKRKKVTRLARLFVYDNQSQFEHLNTRKLLAFHNSDVPGLEGKVVHIDEFHRFKSDYHISDGVDDFGIFSDQYIYLGRIRQRANISGVFSREKSVITTYTSLFDTLWGSSVARPITEFVADKISVEQLFAKEFSLPLIGIEDKRDQSGKAGGEPA